MSPSGHDSASVGPAAALVVGDFTMERGSWFPPHRHPEHQLAWCDRGMLRVRTELGTWLLPPSLALWIPAGVSHATGAVGAALMRSPYVVPDGCPVPWTEPTVVRVGPLLRALIGHLRRTDLAPDARRRAEAVLFDVLAPVSVANLALTRPQDQRARVVAQGLIDDPSDNRTLEEWSTGTGAGARTLARLFASETGMTFGRWRERLRMQLAMPLLAEGRPVESVARRVGYMSGSSFVAAFHRIVGLTPGQYFRRDAAPGHPGELK
ncbi:AraC family transcriptional regulator [Streptomyces abyssalis]|uniref:HTH-type transcriptional regulator RipA n=1 Tax=Streptomyces abyssalis TaxID=933944 RepID=A0A1E7JMX1_9ACTN|nr:helix-turn-helix transcriptional regulator [Streptomyces abyssalis]OEU86988.1 AraC family transcriptional regulator [Streptomyces abyssalis]OEU89627.1 AraC family transcriptional regulator [Streptomyces abyssalis]